MFCTAVLFRNSKWKALQRSFFRFTFTADDSVPGKWANSVPLQGKITILGLCAPVLDVVYTCLLTFSKHVNEYLLSIASCYAYLFGMIKFYHAISHRLRLSIFFCWELTHVNLKNLYQSSSPGSQLSVSHLLVLFWVSFMWFVLKMLLLWHVLDRCPGSKCYCFSVVFFVMQCFGPAFGILFESLTRWFGKIRHLFISCYHHSLQNEAIRLMLILESNIDLKISV